MQDFNPSNELKKIFSNIEGFANKKLSQNFLISEKAYFKIVDSLDIKSTDSILEIGAGPGLLTSLLLKKSDKISVCEIDDRFFNYLESLGIKLIKESFLDIDISNYTKIVGNIPYSITGQIFRKLSESSVSLYTLLIQKEVADRIVTQGNLLYLLVNLWGDPKIITRVPNTAFLPKPKVDSTVITVIKNPKIPSNQINDLMNLAKKSFNQKRKMIKSSYSQEILEKSNIKPNKRPEELTIQNWIDLFNSY